MALSKENYFESALEKFNMKNFKSDSTSRRLLQVKVTTKPFNSISYAPAIESLMYSMVCTRPNIADVVGVVSRFLANHGKEHWDVVK